MKKKWWKEGVVYQIYPRSFNDTTGSGIGDLRGIIKKMDYLKELGVNIIWLNPVYKSPNDDNGYDISDYKDIMDEFGTMEEWEELKDGLHERGIKLIMDLVVNHSSDEHKWFIESKKSKDNPYRDYYIWRDPEYDEDGNKVEPNNWQSIFSGPAWEYDENTDQYYLHLFSKKQPDLNWENSKLRKEIYDMMNWWFDKGVDGFRMDVINLISKYPGLPDYDESLEWHENETYVNGPRFHEFMKEMNKESLKKYDIMTVGECFGLPVDEGKKLVGEDRNELNMVFQMEHVELTTGPEGKWDIVDWKLSDFKSIMDKWYKAMEECNGWGSNFLMNHDQPRSVSTFGDDKEYRKESAKMLATLIMTLKGTPYIYQGEEIGMTNIRIDDIEDFRDLEILNHYKEQMDKGASHDKLMEAYNKKGRDNSRTPMQWDDSKNAGFTDGKPWLKVNPNYTDINVKKSKKENDSIFSYYQEMIKIRKNNNCLIYGTYENLDKKNEEIYSYMRRYKGEEILVLLNFTKKNIDYKINEKYKDINWEVLISNYKEKDKVGNEFKLKPYESLVLRKI
ncbi:MAG: glycoside hydrolase family 13 protein [Fusobacteriota bacterium]